MKGFDDRVDLPATIDEVVQWGSRHGVQLVGFTAGGCDGPEGVAHWFAVTRDQNGHVELYKLCKNDKKQPWARMPGADVTCMTCLVRAAKERWREPS